jgi:Protein of unknown function (DUF3515)
MKAPLALAAVGALAMVAVGVLTGCTPTVALTPAASATSAKCASVVVLLPDTVSTLAKRDTDAQGTGAWGEPADILLHCGVPVPGPNSLECVTVDGIDWLRKVEPHEVTTFTTFGRNPAVSVTINSKNVKADGNQALNDLAIAVAEIRPTHHCTAPVEVIQDGQPVAITTPTATPTSPGTPAATPAPGKTPTPKPTKTPTP